VKNRLPARRKKEILTALIVLFLVSISISSLNCSNSDKTNNEDSISVVSALSGSTDPGYDIADKQIAFSFPQDHGAHESFKNEWWYFTGNLYDDTGRRFGYQLTFFRISLSPQEIERSSNWATNQVYMAHFAISDVENREFHSFEKINRDSLGLAGFNEDAFRISVEDWYIEGQDNGSFPWRLFAAKEGTELSLAVEPSKDIILQGENGLSRKSLDGNNASYYYSITRLTTEGYIDINDSRYNVRGISWLDREWSTSTLSEQQSGWDWFSLQFDDNIDVMYFQLRNKDGSAYPYNEGIIVNPDSSTMRLKTGDVELKPRRYWQSPLGVNYPVEWEAEIKPLGKTVIIQAVFPEQELALSTHYWEGSINIYDMENPTSVIGQGYMELTGYAETFFNR
jgi:predicted secreted hydrolase